MQDIIGNLPEDVGVAELDLNSGELDLPENMPPHLKSALKNLMNDIKGSKNPKDNEDLDQFNDSLEEFDD